MSNLQHNTAKQREENFPHKKSWDQQQPHSYKETSVKSIPKPKPLNLNKYGCTVFDITSQLYIYYCYYFLLSSQSSWELKSHHTFQTWWWWWTTLAHFMLLQIRTFIPFTQFLLQQVILLISMTQYVLFVYSFVCENRANNWIKYCLC